MPTARGRVLGLGIARCKPGRADFRRPAAFTKCGRGNLDSRESMQVELKEPPAEAADGDGCER